jgi:1-deoxy-D-xylulose-5-phosphate reductoisomerase
LALPSSNGDVDVSRGIAILGSTGSIGRSALNVITRHASQFRVVALAARSRRQELEAQVARFRPELAVLADDRALPGAGTPGTRWRCGLEGVLEIAAHPTVDVVLNAIVGAAGLQASLAALQAGKRLALANKESLVVGGALVLKALAAGGGELLPVDSEHSAILQCVRGAPRQDVRRLILTASGGPFRDRSRESLRDVTPAEALRHPTWRMGAKVTIDSATLANKALEVIEAHHLFGVSYDRIDVVIHPTSVVHSMVEFVDGSVLAQLSPPSMELPILYALSWPQRAVDPAPPFDPVALGPLEFEAVDAERFPAFRLGVQAGAAGGTAPAVFNAANEEAVAAFLARALPFPGIAEVIGRVLQAHSARPVTDLSTVLDADRQARDAARSIIRSQC